MSSTEIQMEGYLLKRPRRRRKTTTKKLEFQKRYCCLTSTSLYYYKSKKVRTAKDLIPCSFIYQLQPSLRKRKLSHTAIRGLRCFSYLLGWLVEFS